MIDANTLTELLQQNAQQQRDITYLEGEHDEKQVSFAELHERALGILRLLQARGARRGDQCIIFVANNEHFIQGFWGGVLGGIIPVPVALGISDEHRHKLLRIARKLGQAFLYTDSKTFERLKTFAADSNEQATFELLAARTILTDNLGDLSHAGQASASHGDDPLFIQFSSGSTSEPKGVVLTHRNVLANAHGATLAAGFNENDIGVSWMPLTHDMGLVGMHLIMMAAGVRQYFMPTELFIRRPLLWMEFASRKKATVTTSPNFGYRHFLKVLGDRAVGNWDLSQLRLIFNGAEPIARDLCDEFMTRMAAANLSRTAMFPVYGLAEASLAVSFPKPGELYHSLCFDRHHLNVGEAAQRAEPNSPQAVELVSVGNAIPLCEVRLVDDHDRNVSENHVGHIQIRGDNVTCGYFDDADINAESFHDGWLRTGDLGLYAQGELYITGRAKDIIFVNGQNYYPHDLEAIAQRAPDLELNKVAVAGVRTPQSATDEIIVFVLHRGAIAEFVTTAKAVSRLINEQAGLEVAHVVPVKRIPKTTSGKLQRHLLAEAYLDGEFADELRELSKLSQLSQLAQAKTPIDSALPNTAPASVSIAAQLKAICDAALPDRNIGIEDNLFDVGVSSLKLVEIHEKIDEAFPGLIDLAEIFDHPTIAALATQLESKQNS